MDPSSTRHDRLAFEPALADDSDNTQDYLIFMIGGNPGLISYYEPFLSTLHALLSASTFSESAQFYIYASSLPGFENATLANGDEASEPVGLQQTVKTTEDMIYEQILLHRKATPSTDAPPKVILMGHSVGGYILLEIIRRHKRRVETGAEDFDLIGGILLFPTIVNIAKSPLGIFASVSWPLDPSGYSGLMYAAILENPLHRADCRCHRSILGKCIAEITTLSHHQDRHEVSRARSNNNRPSSEEPYGREASLVSLTPKLRSIYNESLITHQQVPRQR